MAAPTPPSRRALPGVARLVARLLPVAPAEQARFDAELAAHAQLTRDALHRLEAQVDELLRRTEALEGRVREAVDGAAADAREAVERHQRELGEVRTSMARLAGERWDAVAVGRRLTLIEDRLGATSGRAET